MLTCWLFCYLLPNQSRRESSNLEKFRLGDWYQSDHETSSSRKIKLTKNQVLSSIGRITYTWFFRSKSRYKVKNPATRSLKNFQKFLIDLVARSKLLRCWWRMLAMEYVGANIEILLLTSKKFSRELVILMVNSMRIHNTNTIWVTIDGI